MAIRRDQWFKKGGGDDAADAAGRCVFDVTSFEPLRQPSSDDVKPSCFIFDFPTNHQFIWDGSILCVCV
jgi:hypothetical protein